jgi:hypothetical protein
MVELLSALLAYPTVVFTVMVALALLYWLFVILGAFDVDFGGGEALEAATGKAEGALEAAAGKAEGILEAAAGKGEGLLEAAAAKAGALDGAAEGAGDAVDGLADAAEAAAGKGGALEMAHAMRARRVPMTILASAFVFYGWILSYLGARVVGSVTGAAVGTLFGTGVLAAAAIVALPLARLTTAPLGRLFVTKEGSRRADYVGTLCRIQAGPVDERFGQARIDARGADLVVQVRADASSGLRAGDQALIVDYDAEREAYLVEAYDALLKEEGAKAPRS